MAGNGIDLQRQEDPSSIRLKIRGQLQKTRIRWSRAQNEPTIVRASYILASVYGQSVVGPMTRSSKILDEVPRSDRVTDYDRDHFVIYVRLLDAERDGRSPGDMARNILGIDPVVEPDRATKALASHLKRAHWMTAQGYKDLLK